MHVRGACAGEAMYKNTGDSGGGDAGAGGEQKPEDDKKEDEQNTPEEKEDFLELFDSDPEAWRQYVKLLLNEEASERPQPHTVTKLSGEMEDEKKALRRASI